MFFSTYREFKIQVFDMGPISPNLGSIAPHPSIFMKFFLGVEDNPRIIILGTGAGFLRWIKIYGLF